MRGFYLLICVLSFLSSSIARAVQVATIDDFQDGTFMGWSGAATSNISTGGPAGANDHYLLLSSGSFGTVPNLATSNTDARWTGSYTASGVTGVGVDLKILGGSSLTMRAVLFGGSSGATQITSINSIPLAADGLWHHLTFDLQPGSLSAVAGTDSVANVLASVNRIMFRHQSGAASAGGTSVSAQVGMDNVAAVPEPAMAASLALASLLLAPRRR